MPNSRRSTKALPPHEGGLGAEQAVASRHARIRGALHPLDESDGSVGVPTRRDHHPHSGVDQR